MLQEQRKTAEKIPEKQTLKEKAHKVLGPIHIWALGVGIVLVGEFMGWNSGVKVGGSYASLIALWTMAILFIMLILMTSEMASTMPEAGGQYTMAKYLLGPLAAFNIGIMCMLEFAMLEAGDVIVVGQILQSLDPAFTPLPYILLTLLVLAYVNYHGAQGSLTLNFIITAIAFAGVIVLLFATNFNDPAQTLIRLKELTNGIPYGILGIFAAMQFGIWFFLGIDGTALAADECRSANRSLPVGGMIGISTLLIGGTITWFVCSGLIDAKTLGDSVYPLYEAALATGKLYVAIALFIGTLLSCLASANGCIGDASRAWSAMSRDTLLPDYFGKLHPKYGSPYRSIIFLLPISAGFAFTGLLDQVVTFSIFSAILIYLLTCLMMFRFRKMYPMGTIERSFAAPLHPLPAITVGLLALVAMFGMHLNYAVNMIAGALFYFLASVWFLKRRMKFIDRKNFLRPGLEKWGAPKNL